MNSSSDNNLVIYDGVCSFCDGFVKFIIEKSKKDAKFVFIANQDVKFKKKYKYSSLDTILVFNKEGVVLERYKAVKFIFKNLKIKYIVLFFFVFIDLPLINNIVYDFFASIRYKVFGKLDSCSIPDSKIFLKKINSENINMFHENLRKLVDI